MVSFRQRGALQTLAAPQEVVAGGPRAEQSRRVGKTCREGLSFATGAGGVMQSLAGTVPGERRSERTEQVA